MAMRDQLAKRANRRDGIDAGMAVEALILGGNQHPSVERIDRIGHYRQTPFAVGGQKAAQDRAVARQYQCRQAAALVEYRGGQGKVGEGEERSQRWSEHQPDGATRWPSCEDSLSAPGGGEGWGEVGDARALANTHLTLPRLRRGPLPLPPEGRRGLLAITPEYHRAWTVSLPIAVRPVVSGSYMSSTTSAG